MFERFVADVRTDPRCGIYFVSGHHTRCAKMLRVDAKSRGNTGYCLKGMYVGAWSVQGIVKFMSPSG